MIFEADEVFVLYNVVCFIFGKCTENIFTIVVESKKQNSNKLNTPKREDKVVNLWYGLIWPGPFWSSQLHKHKWNILSETAWTICVCVYMSVCLCLYILLWSICSGFIWIITFLWLFFLNFSKARSQSNNKSRNPNPAAEHKKIIAIKKYI